MAPIHAAVKHPRAVASRGRLDSDDVCYRLRRIDRECEITSKDAVVMPAWVSGVGLAAVQIANSVRAKSIALTRTSAKRKQLIDAGAKYVIATEEEDDLVKPISEISAGQGARVVFDPVGQPTVLELIKAMSFYEILYLYGAD
jgi:NADPH:quinone reductase-like Zn-dependent oxidoreductase